MNKIIPLLIAYSLTLATSFAQPKVSLHSLLADMINTDAIARWPFPSYSLKQASSYDRRSVSATKPGWFANTDASQYIRREDHNGHTESVMMDADGPGAIVRFWLTTNYRPGVLRIYLDGSPDPVITIPAYDLLKAPFPFRLGPALLNPHSSYDTSGNGGSTLYLPIAYQKHCTITFEEREGSQNKPHYYQVNYRTYPAGTSVRTFTSGDLVKEKELINKVEYTLWHPHPEREKIIAAKTGHLCPEHTLVVALPKGSHAIRQLVIRMTPLKAIDYEQMLHHVFIRITFDGHTTVDCPLDVFSGSGAGGKDLRSWYRTVKEKEITSRWIMPYKNKATITIVNKGYEPAKITLSALGSRWARDERTMYFHTTWKQQLNTPVKKTDNTSENILPGDPKAPLDWNFASLTGRGVYVGNTFSVYNHIHGWYGEGDQKIWVDRDIFPSEFGTGTEDYYNTSWAPVRLYQTPFANAPRADSADSYGANTFTRTRILDAIPFNHSFRFDWEALGWQDGSIDANAVTYWYGLF